MKLLFVIDMQEATVGERHAPMFAYDEGLLDRINDRIVDYAPDDVVYIRNLMKKNLINRFAPVQVYDGTKEAELAKNLKVVSGHIYDKFTGNAFSNPELVSFVKEKNADEVELVGVDGGGCVALTAIGAVKEGLRVFVNEACVGTIMKKQRDKLEKKMTEMGVVFQK